MHIPLFFALVLFAADPQEDTDYSILATGRFHGDEVTASDGDIWLGVFRTDSGSALRTVEIDVKPSTDPYLDHDDEQTGKVVSAISEGMKPLFLLRPLDSVFQEGSLNTAIVRSPVLMPDTTITLVGSAYLYTTEEGLYLSDGETTQRLSDIYPDSHGERVSVIWAGDLDGDGLLDLVLDDQSHYAMNLHLILFLSSEADPGSLVKEVVYFMAVSC